MPLNNNKRVRLFVAVDGKCEYCGCDMLLSLVGGGGNPIPTLATFEHKYNRDHELRTVNTDEKRILIVCWKCNNEKSAEEPNKNEPKSVLKTTKKIVPKEHWTDEKFIERIAETVEREKNLSRENSKIDAEIKKLSFQKQRNHKQLSKIVQYRQLLFKIKKESPKEDSHSAVTERL